VVMSTTEALQDASFNEDGGGGTGAALGEGEAAGGGASEGLVPGDEAGGAGLGVGEQSEGGGELIRAAMNGDVECRRS
jgi:hypothetical protein